MSAFSLCHRPVTLRPSQKSRISSRSCKTSVAVSASSEGNSPVVREVLTPSERQKINRFDDRDWYAFPRLVHHSDANFRLQVTQLYKERIPEGGVVLDLCSSHVSHLPEDVKYSKVVGHGLNAVELGKNPRLDQFFIRNFNKDPDSWALPSDSFDAVLICCSVQYMQYPERVFAEILRVLKPGGICIITFTHNLFYEKAVAAWRDASMYARGQLVKQYFMAVQGFSEPEVVTSVGLPAASPFETLTRAVQKYLDGDVDPFYSVVSYKNKVDE